MENIRGKKIIKISDIRTAMEEGFDWVCMPSRLIMDISGNQFERFKESAEELDIGFDVCALSLPEEVVITQKGFNTYMWIEYVKKVITRMSLLGCKAVKWSGGASVELPEEGDITEAREQIRQFLYLVRELCGKHDIKFLIEPLLHEDFNRFRNAEQASRFLDVIESDNVGISINSDLVSTEYGDSVMLVEIEDRPENDKADLEKVCRLLRSINYSSWILFPESSGKSDLEHFISLWENPALS